MKSKQKPLRINIKDMTTNNVCSLHYLVCQAIKEHPEHSKLNGFKTLERKLNAIAQEAIKLENDRRKKGKDEGAEQTS